jgi:hypothetical protein
MIMPLEIKELHIRVTVNQPVQTTTAPVVNKEENTDKDAIVAQCVEEVLRIIETKNER